MRRRSFPFVLRAKMVYVKHATNLSSIEDHGNQHQTQTMLSVVPNVSDFPGRLSPLPSHRLYRAGMSSSLLWGFVRCVVPFPFDPWSEA
jgi:hypothetical protein